MEQIGRYQILEELGRGGMGAVYKARDPKTGRAVAIKVLTKGRGASPQQRKRFEREARALAKVRHPNIVRLLDVGEGPGGPYLALEYHEQGSLQDELTRGLLAPKTIAFIGEQLASGLAAAHARGVLHRDLKPDNVLLGKNGRTLITDFGLAKDLDPRGQDERLTQTGAFLGTPGFWSPEQVAGRPDAIGPATDVYGIGAVLYAALTGRPPIAGSNLIEVAARTQHEPPPSISSFRPDTPPTLAAIIARCLEKDPAARWESADALGDALDGFLTAPHASPSRSRGPLPRGPAVLITSAAAAVLLGGWLLIEDGRDPAPRASTDAVLVPSPTPTRSPSRQLDPNELCRLGERAYLARRRAEAIGHWRLAASQGHAKAMSLLGDMRLRGHGVALDPALAARWYRRAAEKDDVQAMHNLAVLHQKGIGGAPDDAAAVVWFRRAAEKGNAESMTQLAGMLLTGRGIAKDHVKAVAWYRRAAEKGDPPGMYGLGYALSIGRGVPKDLPRALEWCTRAAAKGYAKAMSQVGYMHALGLGTPKNASNALAWYRRGAEIGFPHAMLNLGIALENGLGVTRDQPQAARWYRQAAEKGDAEAMHNLAVMLWHARGVPQDQPKAVKWFRRAVDKGHTGSTYNLGLALASGQGVAKALKRGLDLLHRVARGTDPTLRAAAARAIQKFDRDD